MPSAPSLVSFSPIVDELVTQLYLTKTFDNATRHSVALDYLLNKGVLGQDADGGKYIELKARIGEFSQAYRAELAARTFNRVNHDVTYVLPYAFYETTGVLSEEDLAFLQSRQAIVKLSQKMLTRMSDDLGKGLNRQLIQSNATSNTIAGVAAASTSPTPVFGFISVFGYGATATGYTYTTQASTGSAVAAGDLEVLPNVSYCGISTHPTNAISGVDNKVNESTSPVIANWSSTGWNSTASTTYQTNCLDVVSHLIVRLQARGNDPSLMPNFGMQTTAMHETMKRALRASTNQQLVLTMTPQSPDQGMNPRLFLNYEGLPIFPDTDCPTNALFVLTLKPDAAFGNIMPQMPAGNADGPIGGDVKPIFRVAQMPDIDQGGHKVVAKIMLNNGLNPRRQAMAFNFA